MQIEDNNQSVLEETVDQKVDELVQQELVVDTNTTGLISTDETPVISAEEILEESVLDVVLENSKLENYEVILEKFTDIITMTENQLMVRDDNSKAKNIVNIGLEVFTIGAKFCESSSIEDLNKFIAKNFEYLGIYLFTFSNEKSVVGILTNKIDNLFYDFIGNQEDLIQQFNVFQASFKNDRTNDLKSLVSPLMFNLSNIGTNIACIKSIIHYIKLQDEKSIEDILEDIILQIKDTTNTLEESISEESTH